MKTLFESVTGSKGYGLDLPDSDTDILRVIAHGFENYLGLEPYTEAKHILEGENDVVVYDVRFFAKLLLKGSFNALLPLFFEGTFIEQTFEDFIANRQNFFTINSVRSFYGFGNRSYKEFLEKGDYKAAANGLFILENLGSLALYGTTNFYFSELLRSVKRGKEKREDVVWHFENCLEAYKPENLVNETFVFPEKEAFNLLSQLTLKCLERGV